MPNQAIPTYHRSAISVEQNYRNFEDFAEREGRIGDTKTFRSRDNGKTVYISKSRHDQTKNSRRMNFWKDRCSEGMIAKRENQAINKENAGARKPWELFFKGIDQRHVRYINTEYKKIFGKDLPDGDNLKSEDDISLSRHKVAILRRLRQQAKERVTREDGGAPVPNIDQLKKSQGSQTDKMQQRQHEKELADFLSRAARHMRPRIKALGDECGVSGMPTRQQYSAFADVMIGMSVGHVYDLERQLPKYLEKVEKFKNLPIDASDREWNSRRKELLQAHAEIRYSMDRAMPVYDRIGKSRAFSKDRMKAFALYFADTPAELKELSELMKWRQIDEYLSCAEYHTNEAKQTHKDMALHYHSLIADAPTDEQAAAYKEKAQFHRDEAESALTDEVADSHRAEALRYDNAAKTPTKEQVQRLALQHAKMYRINEGVGESIKGYRGHAKTYCNEIEQRGVPERRLDSEAFCRQVVNSVSSDDADDALNYQANGTIEGHEFGWKMKTDDEDQEVLDRLIADQPEVAENANAGADDESVAGLDDDDKEAKPEEKPNPAWLETAHWSDWRTSDGFITAMKAFRDFGGRAAPSQELASQKPVEPETNAQEQ